MTPPTPPLTIYFIEDDADNFLIFQRYLRLAGVMRSRVDSGTTGYTLFRWMETREQVPDIIFLDLRLQQGTVSKSWRIFGPTALSGTGL